MAPLKQRVGVDSESGKTAREGRNVLDPPRWPVLYSAAAG